VISSAHSCNKVDLVDCHKNHFFCCGTHLIVTYHRRHLSAFKRADGAPDTMDFAAQAQPAGKSSSDLCNTGGKKVVSLVEEPLLSRAKLASQDVTQLSTDGVHDVVEQVVSSMSKPWKGSIPIKGRILMRGEKLNEDFFNRPLEDLNIVDHINHKNPAASRLYLCNKMYPPPPNDSGKCDVDGKEEEHPNLTSAKKYISRAALEAGSPITWNGPKKKGMPERRAVCGHHHRKGRLSTTEEITEQMGRRCQKR
jgi:hypothetical protein